MDLTGLSVLITSLFDVWIYHKSLLLNMIYIFMFHVGVTFGVTIW